MSDVEVIISYPWQGHEVGDRVPLTVAEARQAIRAGVAVYATASDARGAGEPDAEPATKRRRSSRES